MKCSDVMTQDPVCCLPDDTARHAATLMKDRDVGPIPVIQDDGSRRLVGIVTDRDLVVKLLAEGRDAKTELVAAVMTRDPVTCRPDDDLDQAVRLMGDRQVRRLPVVDRDQRLVGIISQADVATRANGEDRTAELVREVSRD